MAQDDKKRSETLTRAMKSVGAVEIQYAKLVTKMSNKTRLKMYRKIASLMSNRFSLMDALDLLYDGASNGGKSPGADCNRHCSVVQVFAKRFDVCRRPERLGSGA